MCSPYGKEACHVKSASSSLAWERSAGCEGGSCVEATSLGGEILVRDSKDPDGPVLRFDRAEWDAFLRGIHEGQFRFAE
jgi:uncharacterized protein DUF397